MEEVKISFKHEWSDEGTHFLGRFTVTKEIFDKFQEYVSKTLPNVKDWYASMYLSVPFRKTDKFIFLNLTQRSYFVTFMKEAGIKFNMDRAFTKNNYYLSIVNA